MPSGKRVPHFATKKDYESVLDEVLTSIPLKFVIYESVIRPEDFRAYNTPLEFPEFGVNHLPDWLHGVEFLTIPKNAVLHYEYWPNRQVAEKYGFFGQQGNDRSVIFHPSSYYRGKDAEGLLWGEVNTISNHPDSQAIFNTFKKSIKRHFEYFRHSSVYVGPEAVRYFEAGGRLTQDLRRPKEGDAKRVPPATHTML